MEIGNNTSTPSLLNTTNQTEQNSTKKTEKTEQVPTKNVDNTQEEKSSNKKYDFLFKNADEKFLDSFSQLTASMPIMDASFLKTKVEVNLINYHREQITAEIKAKLGDDVEITDEMKQKIFNEAKERADDEGFSTVNINNFLGYINQNISMNPLLQTSSDSGFFSSLQAKYNSISINSLG